MKYEITLCYPQTVVGYNLSFAAKRILVANVAHNFKK